MGLERSAAQVRTLGRTLILGGSGFIGRELLAHLGGIGTSRVEREGFVSLDATDVHQLRSRIRELEPRIVINCIGLADVDRAETDPTLADTLNRGVVENIMDVQRSEPFRLVQISTDYVFDGLRGAYRESDPAHPINEYGRSKLAGERSGLRSSSALVLRISSPYGKGFGARKLQFFRYVADALRTGKPVKALTDQKVTATYLPDLARAIPTLVDQGAEGIVHVGSTEALTRFEFAREIARVVRADPGLVNPGIRTDMAQWTAPRPADTSLDVGRSLEYGVTYTPVARALEDVLAS